MAAVLSRNINDIKKITIFMDECKRMNISVFGPDVNESNIKFTVTSENNIRFGLGAIKGVGEGAALKIMQERTDNGHYKNIFDFVERVNLSSVNKKNIEGLVMSGAFDSFSEIRREHFFAVDNKDFSFIENLIKYGNKIQNEKNTSQISLFGDKENFDLAKPEIPKEEGWSKLEKLNKEKDVIGIYLSAHPLDDYRFEIAHFCNTTLSDLQDLQALNGKELTFAAIVTAAKNGTTKTGKPFGSLTLQDYTDNFQFAIFSGDYINFSKYFAVGYSLLVKGRVQPNPFRNEELEFKVKSITILSEVKNEFIKSISLKIPLSAVNNKFIKDLKQLSETYKGKILLKFYIYDPDENMSINMFSRNIRINLSNTFLDFLENIPNIELKVN